MRALEENGVIKGYTVIIDRAAVGLPETIVVGLFDIDMHPKRRFSASIRCV